MAKTLKKKKNTAFPAPVRMSDRRETPASSAGEKGFIHKPLFHIFLIFILALLAYSNTFHVPFHFDDKTSIVKNPAIRDVGAFVSSTANFVSNRFVGYLTFALNYKLHGLDVVGYHVLNFAVHVANALLVYLLVILSFKTPFLSKSSLKDHSGIIALFSGLLFVAHPIQTQAVTYIVQRLASLATMFYLLSLAMYIKARQENQVSEDGRQKIDLRQKPAKLKFALFYLTSVLCSVFAMKTKEPAFTLPLIIMLYEFMFFDGGLKKRILYLVPLLLTMLIIPVSMIGTDKPLGEVLSDVSEVTKVETAMSRWEYLFTQFRVIVTYIRLLFVPMNQNLDYDYPVYRSFFDPNVFLSFVFLLSIIGLGIYLLYRFRAVIHGSQSPDLRPATSAYRLISFGIFWFFVTLLVESSIIPILDVIFEHRVYLPSVGAFIAITTSVFVIINGLRNKWPQVIKIVVAAFIFIILVLSGGAYERNIAWQDEVDLWSDVIQKSPEKARGYNNRGFAYFFKKSQAALAIEDLNRAIAINPDLAEAYSNRGVVYSEMGNYDLAIADFTTEISINPRHVSAYFNRGLVHFRKGQYDKAIEDYGKTTELDPYYLDAYNNRGLAYYNIGQLDNAIKDYSIVIDANPYYADAYDNRGIAFSEKGLYDKAADDMRKALVLRAQNDSQYKR